MTYKLEIYDCTLRDGEQTAGASFSLEDRLKLLGMLDDLEVDYAEIGWPIGSNKEEILEAFRRSRNMNLKTKPVVFGSTSKASEISKDNKFRLLIEADTRYACIFGKTCPIHVKNQLKITLEENLESIRKSVGFLTKEGKEVTYDAEHYFDAFKRNKDYALITLENALAGGTNRIVLCDTNGGTLSDETKDIIEETYEHFMKKGIKPNLGVHFHNDCDSAFENARVCLPYIVQVQGTINGMGERIGNLDLTTFLGNYVLKMGNKAKLRIDLKKLREINKEAFRLAGLEMPGNKPYVGNNAFAHKAGVHIDAEMKGASYQHITPECVGNKGVILLNTFGGGSSIIATAREFGYELDKKNELVKNKTAILFNELQLLERKGYRIDDLRAEHFLLINKYFGNRKEILEVENWQAETGNLLKREDSSIFVLAKVLGKEVRRKINLEGGPIDAFYKALRNILEEDYPQVKDIHLEDYYVGIARRSEEESTVRTAISFRNGQEIFTTVGVDPNIIGSSKEALVKGFNYYLLKTANSKV